MNHSLDLALDWCQWCGRPRSEIIDANISECDGAVGRMHPRFFEAQARAAALFDPIVNSVAQELGLNAVPQHPIRN